MKKQKLIALAALAMTASATPLMDEVQAEEKPTKEPEKLPEPSKPFHNKKKLSRKQRRGK